MRLVLAAVGKLKDGAERELYSRYADRIQAAGRGVGLGAIELREIPEGKAQSRDARMADEADRLLAKCGDASVRVLMEERGKATTSVQLAELVRGWRDRSEGGVAFLVGGPDGHGEAARRAATISLSLGPMTLPHGLARIILAEQLYRTATILAGHPYHRA
jgi:23S rRNA (pseudouridine1915-N3)-methyltransferase